jgi:serine/threonine-protein kinase RsbT
MNVRTPMGRPLVQEERLSLQVTRESDVAHVIVSARRFCAACGLSPLQTATVATAASELANNLWMHTSRGGRITLSLRASARGRGIEVESLDEGPGLADVALAMRDGYSTGGGLGCGLPGVQRLMDEFDIDSAPGRGTRVRACKWERR